MTCMLLRTACVLADAVFVPFAAKGTKTLTTCRKVVKAGIPIFTSADESNVALHDLGVSQLTRKTVGAFVEELGARLPEPQDPEAETEAPVQQPLWPELAEIPEEEAGAEDELLDEAIKLVKQERHASTTFLQRRLRIGYVRASRLMDALEEKGIVGPAEGTGRGRKVLHVEEEVSWPTT